MENQKTIAKNTLLLYGRTMITMLIALYTSRVVLQALGVNDYGLYNVVGGVVTAMTALSTTLSTSTQRFITYAIGRGDAAHLRQVFSASLTVHALLALFLFIVAESVGLWFVDCYLTIAPDRLAAAHFILHTTTLIFLADILALPFISCVMAYERFRAYALIYVGQAVMRLVLVSTLALFGGTDLLLVYGAMELIVGITTRGAFALYVHRHFPDCRWQRSADRGIYRELLGFTGWNFFGTASFVVYNQGGNIILNHFYGLALNAAMGVTTQVQTAVSSFSQNFSTAVNPQITKSYAAGEHDSTRRLLTFGSTMAAYLFIIVACPLALNLDYLLQLWLTEVPPLTLQFIRLSLLGSFFALLINPLNCVLFATGDIRRYQVTCVVINAAGFALLYALFAAHWAPTVFFLIIVLQNVLKIFALWVMLRSRRLLDERPMLWLYAKNLLFLAAIVALLWCKDTCFAETTFLSFLGESVGVVLLAVALVVGIGLNSGERRQLRAFINDHLHRASH